MRRPRFTELANLFDSVTVECLSAVGSGSAKAIRIAPAESLSAVSRMWSHSRRKNSSG